MTEAAHFIQRRYQRGQSMIEVLTVSLALVPLAIAVPLIGNYLDMAQTAEEASRYVAFEGMVHNGSTLTGWKSDATLASEVRRRFFGASDAPVKTGDVAGNFAAHRNPLWTDVRGQTLLPDFNANVVVSTTRQNKSALPAAAFTGAFKLRTDNFYHATVSVMPRNVERFEPFNNLNLAITRRSSVIVDPWTARSPQAVASTIEGAGPLAYPIEALKLLGETLGQMPAMFRDHTMDVGNVNPDIVPCDRLNRHPC